MTDCICGEINARHCPVHNEPHYIDFGDPAAFWRHLRPEQALALLKAAPKVAGPWTSLGKSAYRSDHAGCVIAAATPAPWSGAHSARTTADGTTATLTTERVDTLDGAKQVADAALLAAGWTLVPAEEG